MPKAASAAAQKELLLAKYQAAVDAHRRHDLDEALASYQAVLELNPEIAAVHNNVAAIQLGKGNKVQAEASWRRAVSLKADYAEAHFNLAVLLSEQDGHLDEAAHHCGLAIEQKDGYTAAHHLMGNIRSSQRRDDEAAAAYAKAEAMAGGGGGAAAAAGGGAAAGGSYRWDGVEVGHTRRLRLPSGYAEGSGEPTTEVSMETLSLSPLAFLVRGFLSEAECARVVSLAYPKLKASLVMGDARATERTSTSVFLPASEDALLGALQHRLAALAQLPPVQVARSEDLQVVHYDPGATFGMHHDSSKMLPRYLTAFYYLNEVEAGGETAFPAAHGARSMAEAMRLKEPSREGGGLVVPPERGAALLWYNHDPEGRIEPAAVHAGCRVLSGEKWGANHWVGVADAADAAGGAAADSADSTEGGGAEPSEPSEPTGRNAAKNKAKREKAKAKKREAAQAAAAAEAAEPKAEL